MDSPHRSLRSLPPEGVSRLGAALRRLSDGPHRSLRSLPPEGVSRLGAALRRLSLPLRTCVGCP